MLRKASCLHCTASLKILICAVVFNLFLFWVCVSFEFCNTWFSCCCEIKTLFVQLCENVHGNKFQTNFRFLSFSLSSPFSLHWFQVRDAVGDTELGESGMNRSSKLKCKRHFGKLVACAICHCKALLSKLLLYCLFYVYFAVMLWFAWSTRCTLHRQCDIRL